MSLILSGSDGLSDIDGSAATPAIRGTDANTGIFFPAADTIAFAEGGTESMRLDSSGNLGLGVTPSAWRSNTRAIQVGQSGSLAAQTGTGLTYLSSNWYENAAGTDIYISTAAASQYYQLNGTHVWRYAPSGTAGNAITFTQAMTLSSAGYLTVPATPAFAAKQLSNPSTSGYVTTVPAYLLFSSVSVNNSSCYNSANGRFTAPVAGLYYFAWSILVDDSATVNAITSVSLYLNGTNTVYTAYNQNSGNVYIQISQSCVVSLNANDFVNCYVNSGFVHAGSETAFTGYLIG